MSEWLRRNGPQLRADLVAYTGDFKFLVSCKKQVQEGKTLSLKQWQAIDRCFNAKRYPK